MRRALSLAQKAKGTTFPNPAVGAVVVDAGGGVIGEGATDVYGGPHAERRALRKAGAAARGATMYVTLEPCAHFGKTPPCADGIIEAGIARVVTAARDPNPQVSGKGLRRLRAHGIEIQTGLLAKEAELVNEDFFWAITKKRPWIALKLAMTLDGRIADCRSGSKWITSPAARREVQEIRRRHAAVAVGKNTLLCDDPKLTARCGKTYYPARIVFSSGADIPQKSYFWTNSGEARSIVVIKGEARSPKESPHTGGTSQAAEYLSPQEIPHPEGARPGHAPVEYWYTGTNDDINSINTFLDMAYAGGINSILVEGGQRLASAFLEGGFVNKLYLFYGNKILGGGKDGLAFSEGLPIDGGISMKNVTHQSFGEDFLVTGYVK